jgi:hypothetical protein
MGPVLAKIEMDDRGSPHNSPATASTRDSPESGDYFRSTRADEKSRGNSQQEYLKSPISTLASSLRRIARFRRTPSHTPTKMATVMPPSVLVIKQASPEKISVTHPIKIKCRGQARSYPHHITASQLADEEDDVDEHLRKHYDGRSWDMYVRITDFRKNQQHHIQQATGADAYVDGDYSHLQFPPYPSATMIAQDSHQHYEESSDHEMIFGDLEE